MGGTFFSQIAVTNYLSANVLNPLGSSTDAEIAQTTAGQNPDITLTTNKYTTADGKNFTYWLFQNNQVVGPYGREELLATPGFSSESLICPEGRKGTQMGDWQRAGVVAELAEALLKSARSPAARCRRRRGHSRACEQPVRGHRPG